MKRLYYLRHGQSELNVQGKFAGHVETELTADGLQQAITAGEKAKGTRIDVIMVSPLSRAQKTARLFAKHAELEHIKLETTPLLIERDFGTIDSTTWSHEKATSLLNDNLPEGVESWDAMVKRARQLLDEISQRPEDNFLLVGHGAIGRALRKVIEPEADQHAMIPNAELVRWI
jgi:broad specificity phosphatase PhoE